jgi:hypothetical protein
MGILMSEKYIIKSVDEYIDIDLYEIFSTKIWNKRKKKFETTNEYTIHKANDTIKYHEHFGGVIYEEEDYNYQKIPFSEKEYSKAIAIESLLETISDKDFFMNDDIFCSLVYGKDYDYFNNAKKSILYPGNWYYMVLDKILIAGIFSIQYGYTIEIFDFDKEAIENIKILVNNCKDLDINDFWIPLEGKYYMLKNL